MAKHLQNASVVVVNNKQNKRRNPLVWVMVLAFAAVLGVGGTFAYLTFTTPAVENDLSTTTGLKAQIVEENWNKAGGADSATHMAPGDIVAKDPLVWNTSDSEKAYVAMELTFQKKSGGSWVDMTEDEVNKLLAVYSIYAGDTTPSTQASDVAINSADWTKIDDASYNSNKAKRYYYYNNTVGTNSKTSTLFDHVAILKDVNGDAVGALNNAINYEWHIVIRGAEIAVVDSETDTTAASFIDTNNEVNWLNLFPETSSTSDSND